MESDSTLQRRRKPLVMCEKRKYRSVALGVRSRRERSHGYTHRECNGKRKGKKKTRNEMQNGDDGEAQNLRKDVCNVSMDDLSIRVP